MVGRGDNNGLNGCNNDSSDGDRRATVTDGGDGGGDSDDR